jgi:gluconolactonase
MRAPGIYANHARLFDLVGRRTPIVKVAGGFGRLNGPLFSRIGYLLFSDSRGGRICRWNLPHWEEEPLGGRLTTFRVCSGQPQGITFDHQGRLLACERNPDRVVRFEKDGSATVMAEHYGGRPLGNPDDLVYNIDGSIFFSAAPSPESVRAQPPGDRQEVTDLPRPAVYRIPRSQIPGPFRLERASKECGLPTGVALGPRQNRLFLADALQRNIQVHPIRDDGTLDPGRVFAEFPSDAPGIPGGLKTDEQGHLYACGPGGLWVFSPDGAHLGVIVTPEPPTNCGWGRGFRGLYLTTGTSLYFVGTRVAGTRTY